MIVWHEHDYFNKRQEAIGYYFDLTLHFQISIVNSFKLIRLISFIFFYVSFMVGKLWGKIQRVTRFFHMSLESHM